MAEQFVVSAIKYRPQTFDTVIGQEHITVTLKNAIKNNQVAHSFLFCGPRGVGKTTCARILAKTLNCTNRTPDNEACDTCNNCVSFKENTSYNVFELDAASNNSVDDIRTLTEQVRFAPQAGKYKVYIIDEVHMLSSAAFNAFLKTLEEPPSYAIFILATTEKHKILPTILSRCQIFDFNRIKTNDVVYHLQTICKKENIASEEEALHTIALKSEGCMRDALSIMDKIASFTGANITYEQTIANLNILDYDQYIVLLEKALLQDTSGVLLQYDDILSRGFEGDTFLNGFAEHCRNIMLCKDANVVKLLDVTDTIKKKYFTQSNQVSNNFLINALSVLSHAELNYKQARNKRLHVELALIKLCNLANAIQIISSEDGDISKKKIVSNRVTPIYTKASLKIEISEKEIPNSKLEIPNVISGTVEEPTINQQPTTDNQQLTSNNQQPASNLGFQLKGIRKTVSQRIETESQNKNTEIIPITEDNLLPNWFKVIEKVADKIDFNIAIYKQCKLSFVHEKIQIEFSEIVAFERFKKYKLNANSFFKDLYNNDNVVVTYTLNEDATKPDPNIKSSIELREEVLRSYPNIKEFKEKLNLDFN